MIETSLTQLQAWFAQGISNHDEDAWSEQLGLPADAEDRELAQALMRAITEAQLKTIQIRLDETLDPRQTEVEEAVATGDTSLLGQLATQLDVGTIDNVHTLLAVVRGGTLRQRRAALTALGARFASGKGLSGDLIREVTTAVNQVRDIELTYERAVLRTRLPGSTGRQARSERDEWSKLGNQVQLAIRTFWDGEVSDEPVMSMPGDQRAHLLLRTRDLPDLIIEHMAAIIEGADGVSDRSQRLAAITSLRYAGDSRLVPALRTALHEGGDFTIEAALALGRIEDPRVRPALRVAFERAVVDVQRAAIAGALALAGDFRGAGYCRNLLESNDVSVLTAALDGLAAAGGAEDCERVIKFLGHADTTVMNAAVRTLARIGDARALKPLSQLAAATSVSALIADIDDAKAAIAARMELRGEEISEDGSDPHPSTSIERTARATMDAERYPVRVRLRSLWDLLVGQLWLAFGGIGRAIRRFERAAERRPGWGPPLVMIALAHYRKERYAQALVAFRRSLEADRRRVESQPSAIRALAHTFLRRSEQMERDGRNDIARGLIEELQTIDLGRASGAQRMEVKVRFEAQRRRLRA